MDYKEKYKLALERAKKLHEGAIMGGYDVDKKNYETIFPELAESEDEKIRKKLIEYIKTGTYHKDWVSWLERQKSVEWSKEDNQMMQNIIDTLEPLSQKTHSGYAISSMVNWLLSLKQRIGG